MLVIARRRGQRIVIGNDIEIFITGLHKNTVRLGIRAPASRTVLRGEVHDNVEAANRDALATEVCVDAGVSVHSVSDLRKVASTR